VRLRTAALVGALAVGAVACGGGGERTIAKAAGDQLSMEVAAIRQSAAAGDRVSFEAQLMQLTADVAQLKNQGQLSDRAAIDILSAVRSVTVHAGGLPTTTTTTTTTAPPTTTTTTAPPKKKDQGHGGDNGD
jgi:hypothetical protein